MKKILRAAAALALAGCMMTANVFAAPTFSDVPANYWGASFITRAADSGLISGMGDGTFGVSSPLSSAQFTTMICNLLYKSDVTTYQNAYKPADWWKAYMEVAYTKGVLKNTTAGDARSVSGSWTEGVVNAKISRYDMAQIMYNVSGLEKWTMPTTTEMLAAQAKIGDWSKVPAKYQSAVAASYAKSYLSGVDNAGTFAGDRTLNRTEGAVVLCKLMDAKAAADKAADANVIATPTFTNTTKLVNGKAATEDNVVAALKALKTEYPNNALWNMKATYKSVALGNSTGSDAFAYMLADKVFGNLKLDTATAEELKPGDVVYLNSSRMHVVVEDVYSDEFTYVFCNASGKIVWGNSYEIDELTKLDTIYTRYEGEGDYSSTSSDKTLSNGKTATASNVKALIESFLDTKYEDGDTWDKTYKSTYFYKNTVSGDRAFAYYLSDFIFDDLEVEEVDDFDDLRVGDVIYWDDYEEYIVVTNISGDTIDYIGVWNEAVYTDELDVDDLDSADEAYTRYPSASSSSGSSSGNATTADGELANGKSATAANVKSLISKFKTDEYDDGDTFKKTYRSSAFNSRAVEGNEAFAYYLSDYIFGDLEVVEIEDFDDLRVGDVVFLFSYDEYVVVTKIDGDIVDYISVWNGEVYEDDMDVDYLSEGLDIGYTRYPGSVKSKVLSNGKDVTVSNVKDLIAKFCGDKYDVNDKWDKDDSYKSTSFTSSRVYEDQAFSYYFSDYIFDDLEVRDITDYDDLRAGDVVFYSTWDEYLVVTNVNGDAIHVMGVYDEVIYADTLDVDDLGVNDAAWTRYPSAVASTKSTLSDGKAATARNVINLISKFTAEKHKVGSEWKTSEQYTSTAFSSRPVLADQAFAYKLSDYIFGDLKVKNVLDVDDLRVGDVLYYSDWDEYLVITKISGDDMDLIGVFNQKVYTTELEKDDLTSSDYAYTRYPS